MEGRGFPPNVFYETAPPESFRNKVSNLIWYQECNIDTVRSDKTFFTITTPISTLLFKGKIRSPHRTPTPVPCFGGRFPGVRLLSYSGLKERVSIWIYVPVFLRKVLNRVIGGWKKEQGKLIRKKQTRKDLCFKELKTTYRIGWELEWVFDLVKETESGRKGSSC